MRVLSFILVSALWAVTGTAAVYKWTDEQGNVHYTDEPRQGAEAVDLPPVPVFKRPRIRIDSTTEAAPGTQAVAGYSTFAITAPQPQATVRNNPGVVDVHLQVEPELAEGHRIQLYLDDQPVGSPKPGTDLRLSGIYRGTHSVRAEIRNASGQVLARAGPVTFYMHRPSVNLPANPN